MEGEIKDFYKSYLLSYWEIKINMLRYQVREFEDILETFLEKDEFFDIPNIEKKLRNVINLDIHSLLFQITEALYSIIFALEDLDDEYLWFNLSFPRDSSKRSFAIYDKISNLKNYFWTEQYFKESKSVNGSEITFWKYLFYFNIDLNKYKLDINRNRDNIISILHKLAVIFSDRDDYNAYKHSLRCYLSNLKMTYILEKSQKVIDQKHSNYGTNYLTKSKINGNDESINLTYKSFSPNEDLYYIDKAFKLLSNIIEARRSYYHNIGDFDLYFFEEGKKYFFGDYDLIGTSLTLFRKSDFHVKGYNAAMRKDFIEAVKN